MGTQTSTLRLTKPTIGGDATPTWPTNLNLNCDLIDRSANQTVSVSIPDTNVTLTADGTSSDQALYLRYNFTGALTADRTVTLPANQKVGWATNSTTGGKNVILSAGGTTLSLSDGSWTFFAVDGSNNVSAPTVRLGAVNVTGALAVGGALAVTGAATLSSALGVTGAVTLSSTLAVSGTSSFGNITVSGSPTVKFGTFNKLNPANALFSVENDSGIAVQIMNNVGSGPSLVVRSDTVSTDFIDFNNSGAGIGSISNGITSVAYNTTSDQRLKHDDGLISGEDAARIIAGLRPRWFRWRSQPNAKSEPGFFAQQVARVFPWAVRRGRGKPGSEGFVAWQMDAAKLMPVVVAYIQALERRVAELERGR